MPSLLYDCIIETRVQEEQSEVTLLSLELSVVSGPGSPETPEFWKEKFNELFSTDVL